MVTLLTQLNWKNLAAFADDPAVHKRLAEIKYDNKLSLKRYLKANKGIELDENSIVDTQIKRFHEYKRQQMNALYVIHKYLEIKKETFQNVKSLSSLVVKQLLPTLLLKTSST